MKTRKWLTFLTIFVALILYVVNWMFVESGKAAIAVSQVDDSVVVYSFAEKVVNYFGPGLVTFLMIAILFCIWFKPLKDKIAVKILLSLMTISILVSCGPPLVEKYVTIEPNETAYVIPVEGITKAQKGFMSVEFLEDKKVATKRIYLPQRKIKTGRGWWNFEYIPTVTVIRVDRSPVTREWTGDAKTGTEKKDQALWVESSDSIGFGPGINLTAMILEEDTSLFLYRFAGKSLDDIVDKNVRGRVNAILSREFAKYTLEQGRDKKNEIIDKVENETVSYFKKMGITITNVGLAEGLVYEDKEIQQKINQNFIAQMDIQIKENERLSQEKVNQKNISIADAEATAAEKFARAAKSRREQMNIEIDLINAKANLTRAERWKGEYPSNLMPANSPWLLGIESGDKK